MLVSPVGSIMSAMMANRLGSVMVTYHIKLFASIGNAVCLILLGWLSRYGIGAIIPTIFLYSLVMGCFFVSNNSFMMSIATADLRGMIGGCV